MCGTFGLELDVADLNAVDKHELSHYIALRKVCGLLHIIPSAHLNLFTAHRKSPRS